MVTILMAVVSVTVCTYANVLVVVSSRPY